MKRFFWIFALFSIWSVNAAAALTIEITEGMEGAIPIAIVPFRQDQQVPLDPAEVIGDDLRRSGRFDTLATRDMISRPATSDKVNYGDWRMVGVENLVVGRVRAAASGSYVIEFELLDVPRAKRITGFSFPVKRHQLRRLSHHISDIIYKALTGEPGAFETRIAYITTTGKGKQKKFALQVADSDGFNPQTILRSSEPIMSPAWSPDGKRLAYVSFEGNQASVYVQTLATSRRQRVSKQPGVNGAPSWSPDGRQLALTLSRDGNLEIYVLRLKGGGLRRITRNPAIDTEPVWMPDGKSIVFTSDRGGGPQLYRVSARGGSVSRLTFEGRYNADADVTPDGNRVALVHRARGGAYQIGVLESDTGILHLITDGKLDESPSVAPNGSMILYATRERGRGVLAAVSVDGRFRQRLVLAEGEVREPAWSPPER